MYFNFDDNRPDTPVMPRPLSRLEVTLLTIVLYLSIVLLYVVLPDTPFFKALEARRLQAIEAQRQAELQRQREDRRFMYVEPRVDIPAPPPPRADLSDIDRRAATVEKPPNPTNTMPFSRGNSPERIAGSTGDRPRPDVTPPAPEANTTPPGGDPSRPGMPLPDAVTAIEPRATENGHQGQLRGPSTGVIADAIRNVQKYAQKEGFGNLRGGQNQEFSPYIQFDTKGVEFGPWIRRFVAQIRRNWFIPEAAMTLKGRVVITFYVHKDGRITDLQIVRPSSIDGFNNSSYNALAASNPTYPLPPEYPDDRAFFTVTFFYNETPQAP